MTKLQFQLKLILWCCILSRKINMELDQQTKLLASYGQFNRQDLILEKGKAIRVPWEGNVQFKPTTNLELNNCKGSIDKTTFSMLPDLQSVFIRDCHIDCSLDTFSTLKKLGTLAFFGSNISIDKVCKDISTTDRSPLPSFKELNFHLSTVSYLNKSALYDLSLLNKLKFDNADVIDIYSDAFDGLNQITQLIIKTSRIPDFDFSQILKLNTLKYLALHDLDTNVEIDYNIFKSLPNLETILFDTIAYEKLDFDAFPNLKTVEVGFGETKEGKKLDDNVLFNKIMDRIESFRPKGIQNKFVRAGKDYIVALDSTMI